MELSTPLSLDTSVLETSFGSGLDSARGSKFESELGSPLDLELQACLSLFLPRAQRESFLWPSVFPDLVQRAQQVQAWCEDEGARILYPGHEDYPFEESPLESKPAFVACWGGSPWKSLPCLAVVGSREPSRSASEWMQIHLADFLRQQKCVIVSGGARGIDQQAHLLAIRAGRPTVVFLPSGLAHPYPAEWRKWKDDVIAAGGAIISTYHPRQEIRKSHFEERNRLIAAISRLLFVVEARRRSGSSMTARLAREIGRNICCLPGSPGDVRCEGTVDLLFEGGFPVRDAADLQVLFGLHAL